jgi:hypothetical protein
MLEYLNHKKTNYIRARDEQPYQIIIILEYL